MHRVGSSYNSSALLPTFPWDWWEGKIAWKPWERCTLAREPRGIILDRKEGSVYGFFSIFFFFWLFFIFGQPFLLYNI